MSSNHHSLAKPALPAGRTPWLVFLFLAVVLFFVYHDLANARSGIGNYDAAEDVIAGVVSEGSVSRRVALISLAIFAVVTLIRHRADGALRIKGSLGWILLGYAAMAILSPLWAEDRALTLTRVTVFAILCVAAVAIVRLFSLREMILWTCFTSGAYLALGVLAEVVFGNFHPFASGYRFAGTLHPNMQGINCALFMLSGIAAADLEKHRRILYRIAALAGFVFLILTASRTAFAAALLALAVYEAAIRSTRTKIVMAYALSIIFCILLLFLANGALPSLKAAILLGRDDSTVDSLNGRAGIWDELGPFVERRPILGYGYGGFWTPAHISEISEGEKWGIPNSHSAYLDNLVMLGMVGLLSYVFLLFAGIRRAFQFQNLTGEWAFAFVAAVLVFCALDGFLESAIVDPSLPMFLSTVAFAQLAFVRPVLPCRTAGEMARSI